MTPIESQLAYWAKIVDMPSHKPGWAAESIEYRIESGDAMRPKTKGSFHGDGGLVRAVHEHREEMDENEFKQRMDEAMRRLKLYAPDSHATLTQAFCTWPGHIMPQEAGARDQGISRGAWRDRYKNGLAFLDGVLAGSVDSG